MMTEEHALSALSLRLGEARAKHPTFAKDAFEAYRVIADEVLELRHAIGGESRQRQIDEALDVMATCMRFILGEHQHAR